MKFKVGLKAQAHIFLIKSKNKGLRHNSAVWTKKINNEGFFKQKK